MLYVNRDGALLSELPSELLSMIAEYFDDDSLLNIRESFNHNILNGVDNIFVSAKYLFHVVFFNDRS